MQQAHTYLRYLFPKRKFDSAKLAWFQDQRGQPIGLDLYQPDLKLALVLKSKKTPITSQLISLALQQQVYVIVVPSSNTKTPDQLYNYLDQEIYKICCDLKIQTQLLIDGVIPATCQLTSSQKLLLGCLVKWFEPSLG